MPDKLTPEQRRKCMSHIRAKDTKPEMVVRRWLWAEGFRYRLHTRNLVGKPDIVFRKLKTVIFINGCYWHGHNIAIDKENSEVPVVSKVSEVSKVSVFSEVPEVSNSVCCKIPHTNREFWVKKIIRNKERDLQTYQTYIEAGWTVLVVWECQLRGMQQREMTLKALSLRLSSIILNSLRQKPKVYEIEEDEQLGRVAETEDML